MIFIANVIFTLIHSTLVTMSLLLGLPVPELPKGEIKKIIMKTVVHLLGGVAYTYTSV